MDTCEITPEQIEALASGEGVQLRYDTLEDYGETRTNYLQLRPKGDTRMTRTRDGQSLLVGHAYWKISFEEDSDYLDSSTKCVYEGSSTRDNQQFLDSLPPDCSGMPMQRFEEIHRFRDFSDPNTEFCLDLGEIKDLIIGNPCNVEEVTKLVLKV